MNLELIPASAEHAPELSAIFYHSFQSLFDHHNVPGDLPSPEVAGMIMQGMSGGEHTPGVAALLDGQIVGGNFYTNHDAVAGVGPIFVDPNVQAKGVGRALMQWVVDHARQHNGPMVRLLQDSVNTTSLSLYASLGFDLREPVALMDIKVADSPNPAVRPVTPADLEACDALCQRIYKVSRKNELAAAVSTGEATGMKPLLLEEAGRIAGYITPGFFGHGVAETNEQMVALARHVAGEMPPGAGRSFCPLRNTEMFRQLLTYGSRVLRTMNIMSMGPYETPSGGAWVPSIGY